MPTGASSGPTGSRASGPTRRRGSAGRVFPTVASLRSPGRTAGTATGQALRPSAASRPRRRSRSRRRRPRTLPRGRRPRTSQIRTRALGRRVPRHPRRSRPASPPRRRGLPARARRRRRPPRQNAHVRRSRPRQRRRRRQVRPRRQEAPPRSPLRPTPRTRPRRMSRVPNRWTAPLPPSRSRTACPSGCRSWLSSRWPARPVARPGGDGGPGHRECAAAVEGTCTPEHGVSGPRGSRPRPLAPHGCMTGRARRLKPHKSMSRPQAGEAGATPALTRSRESPNRVTSRSTRCGRLVTRAVVERSGWPSFSQGSPAVTAGRTP